MKKKCAHRNELRQLVNANQLEPDNPDTLREMGKILKARGFFEKAFLHFENMRLISEGDPERKDHLRSSLFHGGECLLRLGCYKEAVGYLDRCVQIAPEHQAAPILLLSARQRKGAYTKPSRTFDLRRKRNELLVLRRLCSCLREKGHRMTVPCPYPPGHYFSPYPDLEEIHRNEKRLFKLKPRDFLGIDLNRAAQMSLLRRFPVYYREMPFPVHADSEFRYHLKNPSYTYADGIVLHCMIRHFKPRNIIEVGSGNSTCMILDTNERFFSNRISCTFIDPYPQYVKSLFVPRGRWKNSHPARALTGC